LDAAEKSKVNPAYDDPIVVGKSLKLQSNRNTEFLVPIEMIEATPEILARVRIFTFFRKKNSLLEFSYHVGMHTSFSQDIRRQR
jgi:hypothetical protein